MKNVKFYFSVGTTIPFFTIFHSFGLSVSENDMIFIDNDCFTITVKCLNIEQIEEINTKFRRVDTRFSDFMEYGGYSIV